MSIGQKLYDYQCKSCGFEKGVPKFVIEEFRIDMIFRTATSLDEDAMLQLICPRCGCKFEYKNWQPLGVS